MQRRHLVKTLIAAAVLATTGSALAQNYPSKVVRVIIPFPAGGPTDSVGRFLAQKLGEQLGQNFMLDEAVADSFPASDPVALAMPRQRVEPSAWRTAAESTNTWFVLAGGLLAVIALLAMRR